jgi:hypothetical protein
MKNKKIKMKKVFLLLLLFSTYVSAQYERPGSTSAQFLRISPSARAAGMSNAYISVVNNAEATFFNPAALTRVENLGFSVNHTNWFAGINHDYATIAFNIGNWGIIAASMTALYTDEMKVRTPLQPEGTGETFYAGSYRAGISYGKKLTDHVSFGTSLSYLNITLAEGFSSNAVSLDVAILYTTNFRGFSFGMMISNFGSNIEFVNESYPQPTSFSFGLSFNLLELDNHTFLISGDGVKPNDGKPSGRIGAEWAYSNLLFLRSGYRFNHDSETFSIGTGLNFNIGNSIFSVDYSYSDYSELGAANRIGLSWLMN